MKQLAKRLLIRWCSDKFTPSSLKLMSKISRRKFIIKGVLATITFSLLNSYWFKKYVIEWNYFDISKKKTIR
jgi:hypothetical protein